MNNIQRLNSLYLNIERFQKMIFEDYYWNVGKIEPNSFLTASSVNEISTWHGGCIRYCPIKKVFYKYPDQLNRSFNAFKKYENSNKWRFNNNMIVL